MTFSCPYFSPAVMVKFHEKGDRTLCDAYWNEHASNHTHIWTYLLDCEHSLFFCSRIILIKCSYLSELFDNQFYNHGGYSQGNDPTTFSNNCLL